MRAKAIAFFALLLAALLGLLWLHFRYLNLPVEFSVGGAGDLREVSTNLGVIVLVAILGSVVLLVAWKLFYLLAFLPLHLKQWNVRRKERRRMQNVSDGLQALVLGDGDAQRKNFSAAGAAGVAPAVSYYLAALAAPDSSKRQGLLKKAAGADGDPMIQAMATAQMRINASMPGEAAEVLRMAGAATSKANRPLSLLLEACEKSGDIRGALDVAQTLLERSPSPLLRQRIGHLAGELLKNEGSPDAIRGLVGSVRKSHPSSPTSIAIAAAKRLAAVKDEAGASNILGQAWSQSQDAEILAAIAKHGSAELVQKILGQSDELLRRQPDDLELMCALADLAMREKILGQARKLLADALRLKESRPVYLRLARLAELEGKATEESGRLYRLAAQAGD
ncbi:MAG: hypothetical protein ISN26_02775 [Betaproteobacteria bacterium AqS2]|uniref:HemY N-terminal domain-containing protein n=1 Tax=Candidatus Amphirhobacter heronislandensis TaxID=1732024 RepID=A0A930UFU7_9GAMM|nr:hypothetical protein [Betaproteobacteria bacterium AqS2]